MIRTKPESNRVQDQFPPGVDHLEDRSVFLDKLDIFVTEHSLVWCGTAQWKPSAVWGPPFARGIMTGECLTPQPPGMGH